MRGGAAVAPRKPPRQLFVVVERQSAAMRVRLAPAGLGGERFAVVNHGVGIAAVEFLGDGERDALAEAYHVFRRLERPSSGDPIETAFAAWQGALARAGIHLRRERTALYGAPLPRTNWSADDRGISLRPWDIELSAIDAGLRRIVKLDRVPDDFVPALRSEAARRGLLVEIVVPPTSATAGAPTLLLSRDAATLAEASELERRLIVHGGDPGAEGAASKMGGLLGYPPCCVGRFARVAEHNDTTLAWALLPEPRTPATPLTQWLQPGLALLSHSPCDLECAASVTLGRSLLEALEAKESGFAARWRGLAGRLQVVDQRDNRVALAVDGPLEAAPAVAAADLLGSSGGDADAEDRIAGLVGHRAILEDGGLVVAECDWYAPYVADHRGPF
jgi:hypothetical protein